MLNKYEEMNNALHKIAKMGIPVSMSINKWGQWKVQILGQKFINKDVCIAVREAVELVLKVKS